MNITEKFSFAAIVAILLFGLALVYGWFANLTALIHGCIDFTAASNWALLLLRAVGVFVAPLGGFLGLLV